MKYVSIFYFLMPLISLITVSFVKEDLKRLRYKLQENLGNVVSNFKPQLNDDE